MYEIDIFSEQKVVECNIGFAIKDGKYSYAHNLPPLETIDGKCFEEIRESIEAVEEVIYSKEFPSLAPKIAFAEQRFPEIFEHCLLTLIKSCDGLVLPLIIINRSDNTEIIDLFGHSYSISGEYIEARTRQTLEPQLLIDSLAIYDHIATSCIIGKIRPVPWDEVEDLQPEEE